MDFFQLCKGSEHFFNSDFVKIYSNLIISAAFYDIFNNADTEFDMAHGITDSVIKRIRFGHFEVLWLKCLRMEILLHLKITVQ